MSNRYGFDDHMTFVQEAHAQAQIMVPFASLMPAAAAEWVRYSKARGYDVKRWEIGNEPDRAGQCYWLSPNRDEARRQYVFGTYQARGEPADGACVWGPKTTKAPNQESTVRYSRVPTTPNLGTDQGGELREDAAWMVEWWVAAGHRWRRSRGSRAARAIR